MNHEEPEIKIPGVVLGEELSRGGFGAIYRRRHLALDVDVAVKVIHTSAGSASDFERTLRDTLFVEL